MVPPFLLHSCGVWPEIEKTAPFASRRSGRRPRNNLAAKAELLGAALPAVGAFQKEGHIGVRFAVGGDLATQVKLSIGPHAT